MFGYGLDSMDGLFEYCSGPSGSMEWIEFLYWLGDCQVLMKVSALCT
jgi:hypothetical protein